MRKQGESAVQSGREARIPHHGSVDPYRGSPQPLSRSHGAPRWCASSRQEVSGSLRRGGRIKPGGKEEGKEVDEEVEASGNRPYQLGALAVQSL